MAVAGAEHKEGGREFCCLCPPFQNSLSCSPAKYWSGLQNHKPSHYVFTLEAFCIESFMLGNMIDIKSILVRGLSDINITFLSLYNDLTRRNTTVYSSCMQKYIFTKVSLESSCGHLKEDTGV